jgi:hypothetical protein
MIVIARPERIDARGLERARIGEELAGVAIESKLDADLHA